VSDEQDSAGTDPEQEPVVSNEGETGSSEEEAEFVDPQYQTSPTVMERNGFIGNKIVVYGDFTGSVDGEGDHRSSLLLTDITEHVETVEYVKTASFEPTAEAIEKDRLVLLAGSGCGNWLTASVALRRTGHKPILELPGSLSASDLVEMLKLACKEEGTGVLIDSVDSQTLASLRSFDLRHLRNVLPSRAAVVFTIRDHKGTALLDGELPTVEGVPPDGEEMLQAFARSMKLPDEALARARAALKLLPEKVGPGTVRELAVVSTRESSPEDLAALVAGKSQVLDAWLEQQPGAGNLAAVATAAAVDGLPSTDFERASAVLTDLLQDGVEPPEEAIRFGPRAQAWPAGLVTYAPGYVSTYFGWQPTEVVEICPPHQSHAVVTYLWGNLDGSFRQPFLRWLRELPDTFGGRLGFAAARTAGVLFATDPVTIEQELLRPWARDDRTIVHNCAAFALGMPAALGSDLSSVRRLLNQWSSSRSPQLREAALAAYGGPLGIWDPGTAAASKLWEAGWKQPELTDLSHRSLASLYTGGAAAERARATTTSLLVSYAGSKEAPRVFELLPLIFGQLTRGAQMARESFESLLSESETATREDLTALLAQAFDSRQGRSEALATLGILTRAVGTGRINRAVLEQLIREMKAEAKKRDRLSELGGQLRQALKAIERNGGDAGEVARSIHETFYKKEQGGKTLESK
jgi:hypothetical protein